MTFLHWLSSLFRRPKKGYTLEIPIGLQKKKKRSRLALFGKSDHGGSS